MNHNRFIISIDVPANGLGRSSASDFETAVAIARGMLSPQIKRAAIQQINGNGKRSNPRWLKTWYVHPDTPVSYDHPDD